MMKKLFVNGKDLSEFGVMVNGVSQYSTSEYDYEEHVIPNRNGALFLNNERMQNVKITYSCMIRENMNMNIQGLKDFLYSTVQYGFGTSIVGYNRIQDEYEPYFYRIGFLNGQIEISPFVNKVAFFELTFICFGMKFYVSGDEKISLSKIVENNGIVYNPYLMSSRPLIYLYKDGKLTTTTTLKINESTITMTGNDNIDNTFIYVSSEDNMIYQLESDESHQIGDYVSVYVPNCTLEGEFPKLRHGDNKFEIETDCDLEKSYMIARWCAI